MTNMASGALCAVPSTAPATPDQQIRQRVQRILRQHRYQPVSRDRRDDRREPFPYPIHVTPVGQDGSVLTDETIVVLGKHISERGLDFYCEAPLPHRRVIVSWEGSDGNWLSLLLELRWCRSTKYGWCENGGRFLQTVASPLGAATEDWSADDRTPQVET